MSHLASVSVVVATYRRRHALAAVVSALLADTATLEVIVVVDGCADGSYELLQAFARKDRRVRAVWQENAGAAAARATGLELARGPVVLFLDDDVVAAPDLVAGHAQAHAEQPGAVVVGYMPPALPSRRSPGQVATFLYARDYDYVCAAYERDSRQILLNLWAGNVSLRRDDALEVGLSAAGDVDYHADKQFGYRCRAAGLDAVFRRELRAVHRHERTLPQFRQELRRQARDRLWFASAHPELESEGWLVKRSPVPLEALLRTLAAPSLYRAVSRLLVSAISLAGHARLWFLETSAARLLRQVELLHHAR